MKTRRQIQNGQVEAQQRLFVDLYLLQHVKRGGVRLMFVYNGVLSDARLAVWIRFVEMDNYELCEEVDVSRVT